MNYKEKCETIINDIEKWSYVKITKDVRRIRIEPDVLGVGEEEYYTYTVTCYIDGEKIDSKSVKSVIEAGEIAQSYETFIKYYNQN